MCTSGLCCVSVMYLCVTDVLCVAVAGVNAQDKFPSWTIKFTLTLTLTPPPSQRRERRVAVARRAAVLHGRLGEGTTGQSGLRSDRPAMAR